VSSRREERDLMGRGVIQPSTTFAGRPRFGLSNANLKSENCNQGSQVRYWVAFRFAAFPFKYHTRSATVTSRTCVQARRRLLRAGLGTFLEGTETRYCTFNPTQVFLPGACSSASAHDFTRLTDGPATRRHGVVRSGRLAPRVVLRLPRRRSRRSAAATAMGGLRARGRAWRGRAAVEQHDALHGEPRAAPRARLPPRPRACGRRRAAAAAAGRCGGLPHPNPTQPHPNSASP
jgi:hypothetical protein